MGRLSKDDEKAYVNFAVGRLLSIEPFNARLWTFSINIKMAKILRVTAQDL